MNGPGAFWNGFFWPGGHDNDDIGDDNPAALASNTM